MKANRCPYLGMQDDPDTRLDFPSPGNACHKASTPGPVKPAYQQSTCLTGEHIRCPVYTAASAIPLPASIADHQSKPVAARRALPARRLPLALALLLVLGFAVLALANGLGASGRNGSAENDGQGGTRTNFFSLPRTGSNGQTATLNPTSAQLRTACPMPEDWMLYTVNPTDSLYRLSVVHGVPVEELQRVNCMGDETVILPGQVIYVPFTATLTPTATSIPTRFVPASTFTPAPGDDGPAPVIPPTAEPPTSAPPTRVATTPVPTTAVPPTQAPTQAPTTAVPPTAIVPTIGIPTIGIPTIPLPTLPPIIEPTEPPQPGGGNNNRNDTVDCGGGVVTIDGNNNSVDVIGACLGVVVNGNNNHVSVPPGTPVTDRGKNNVINEG